MHRIETVSSHLKAAAHERRRAGRAAAHGELPFVTVSRQAGAGGRSLARAILQELEEHQDEPRLRGWSSFDEEICSMIVSDPKLHVSLEELLHEDYRTRAEDFVSVMLGKSFQDDVQKKISVTIRKLAVAGKAVLIGRGAALITRDLAHGVHVRLVAPREARIRRTRETDGLSEAEAARKVDELDRARVRMVKSRFGRDVDDPLLYHAVWNTELVPMHAIARSVVELIRSG